MASSISAVSMTVRAIGLMLETLAKTSADMSCGTTPADC